MCLRLGFLPSHSTFDTALNDFACLLFQHFLKKSVFLCSPTSHTGLHLFFLANQTLFYDQKCVLWLHFFEGLFSNLAKIPVTEYLQDFVNLKSIEKSTVMKLKMWNWEMNRQYIDKLECQGWKKSNVANPLVAT